MAVTRSPRRASPASGDRSMPARRTRTRPSPRPVLAGPARRPPGGPVPGHHRGDPRLGPGQFGSPVADARIAIRETRTNYERALASSDLGTFTATLLPLGSYDVTVQASGWSEVRRTGVPVRAGETVELTLEMVPQMRRSSSRPRCPRWTSPGAGRPRACPRRRWGTCPTTAATSST